MLAPTWTWWSCLPVALVAVGVLFGPGAGVLALLGLRRWVAVSAAPLVTVTLVGSGGLAFGLSGLPWTPLTAALLAAVVLAGAWAVGRRRPGPAREPLAAPDAHRALATALAAVIIVAVVVQAAGRPGNFPQNPDMLYHLDLTRWFVDHATASSLDTSLGTAGPQFYPAALHGVAATVAVVTGAPAIIALTCTELAFVAVAWPLGLFALLDALGRLTVRSAWPAALLATAFPIFPFRLLGYGPLWPFDAGLALVPVWLALLAHAADAGARPLAPRPLLVALAVFPGLGLLHAGVALTALIPAGFLAVEWAFSGASVGLGRARTAVRVLALGALPALVWLGVLAAPAAMVTVTTAEPAGYATAIADALRLWAGGTSGPRAWPGGPDQQLLASALQVALIGAGVLAVAVARKGWWLVATTAATGFLALQLDALGSQWARWLTWPWQNVEERLRAATGLFGIILACIAVAWFTGLGGRRTRRAAVGSALVLAALLSTVAFATDRVTLGNYYRGAARVPWLTSAEADALRALSAVLPDDAVVVADPWRGASFLQAIGPERMFIPTEKTNNDDIRLVAGQLDRAAHAPAVCDALRRAGASHLITGGDPAGSDGGVSYVGFERAADAPGFVVVAREGPYTLFRIDACAR